MDKTVAIVFAHHHGDNLPGDRVEVEPREAHRLVRGGRARYANKTDAVKAEGEAGAAQTVNASKAAAVKKAR